MKWSILHGDILDIKADILICSANPYLNLSGGVGGALLLRYGSALQSALHEYLRSKQRAFVDRGTIVETGPCGSPYRTILHAVAVDGFYESSKEVAQDIVNRCLLRSVDLGAKSVSLTALATGYGRLTISEFGQALLQIRKESYSSIEEVIIVVRSQDEAEEIKAIMEKS
jgi:O-acetyl-ADP-ribose deacetylase